MLQKLWSLLTMKVIELLQKCVKWFLSLEGNLPGLDRKIFKFNRNCSFWYEKNQIRQDVKEPF